MTRSSLHRRLAKAEESTPLPPGCEIKNIVELTNGKDTVALYSVPEGWNAETVRLAIVRRVTAIAAAMGHKVEKPRAATKDELAAAQAAK